MTLVYPIIFLCVSSVPSINYIRCCCIIRINRDSSQLYLDSSLRVGKPLYIDILIQEIKCFIHLPNYKVINRIIFRMINSDFNSLSQYRSDGRKNDQMRNTEVELSVHATADGSCLFRQGLTEVLCLINGPYQRPSNSDFLLKIEYTVAPFSSLEKRKIKHDRQFSQFVENVRKSFEGVILSDLYRKNQIEILVTVLQNQGSAKSAVMNCISLALANAGISMRDMLVSCTVGTLHSSVIVDPNEDEQYEIANEFVISFLPDSNNLDCVQLKKAKIKQDTLKQLHKSAINSCRELYNRIRKALIGHSLKNMLIF